MSASKITSTLYIPSWLVWVQSLALIFLYSCWIQPEIVGFRNTSLVLGATIGVYVIYIYRQLFISLVAVPMWLILGLFFWAIAHFLFLGHNYQLQAIELHRIWKYAFLAAIFALGFGLTLGAQSTFRQKLVLYLALTTPVIIYLIKYLATAGQLNFGWYTPPSLKLAYLADQAFYIPKTDYVAFTLPVLAVSLGKLSDLLGSIKYSARHKLFSGFIFISVIAATCFLYLDQNIKNGMLYTLCLLVIFSALMLFRKSGIRVSVRFAIAILSFLFFGIASYAHIQKNESWRSLVADAKVAVQLDKYRNWTDTASKGYPMNELGKTVVPTNYERIAWGKVGLQISVANPLGYGLIEDSFVHLVREELVGGFNLSHSHSGWLDLALGIGIPGLLFIWVSMFLIIMKSRYLAPPWGGFIYWSQLSLFLLWFTTEVSSNTPFPELIFWICITGGICMTANHAKKIQN